MPNENHPRQVRIAASRVVRLSQRDELLAQSGRTGQKWISCVVSEEPKLKTIEDRRLRTQIVFQLSPRERIRRQPMYKYDWNLSRLKRLAHVQPIENVAPIRAQ